MGREGQAPISPDPLVRQGLGVGVKVAVPELVGQARHLSPSLSGYNQTDTKVRKNVLGRRNNLCRDPEAVAEFRLQGLKEPGVRTMWSRGVRVRVEALQAKEGRRKAEATRSQL